MDSLGGLSALVGLEALVGPEALVSPEALVGLEALVVVLPRADSLANWRCPAPCSSSSSSVSPHPDFWSAYELCHLLD